MVATGAARSSRFWACFERERQWGLLLGGSCRVFPLGSDPAGQAGLLGGPQEPRGLGPGGQVVELVSGAQPLARCCCVGASLELDP